MLLKNRKQWEWEEREQERKMENLNTEPSDRKAKEENDDMKLDLMQ
jgi:hypothetical protein